MSGSRYFSQALSDRVTHMKEHNCDPVSVSAVTHTRAHILRAPVTHRVTEPCRACLHRAPHTHPHTHTEGEVMFQPGVGVLLG